MIPALREAFNRNFLPETYQQFLKNLEASAGTPIAFRVSETPCFLPKACSTRWRSMAVTWFCSW
jgi:hypothetical protein